MAPGWLVDHTLLDGSKPMHIQAVQSELGGLFLKSKEGHGIWRRWRVGGETCSLEEVESGGGSGRSWERSRRRL